MLWIGPFYQGKMAEEALAKGWNLAGQVRLANGNNYPMVDMTNPDARAYWQDGVAKLLDFGLAKLRPHPVPGSSETVTEPSPLTAEGAIVGTLQYMAPEQLEGREADARSDIFALGALLYEMITGRKAFEGKSQASVISGCCAIFAISISSR